MNSPDNQAPNPIAPVLTALAARLPTDGTLLDGDTILEHFLDWVAERGLELYPAQEEAILELVAGNHVVLNTPTGSGKSLVAIAMHFYGMARGLRSFYTSPIKALVSEKFFDLCRVFGAQHVGMLTGDASINPGAPIVCCTAEVLSNMALRLGDEARADLVCMDEFHYYSDRERGSAWQIPLLILERVRYLLMSATLGDMRTINADIEARTGAPVRHVRSAQRPVPLEFEYSERPTHEAIERLVEKRRHPVYIVHFTQREAAEQAQALTSVNVCSKEEKDAIAAELKGFRFDSPYGKDMERFVRHGVGLHHAGLLPRYRLLVEKLSQKGLLKVICGTDTLGVGINVPIRSVLFSQLCKFDGDQVRILSVREFKQIAGRAGRKGFDDVGYVVVQAPAHVIENKRALDKLSGAKLRKYVKAKPPTRGFKMWGEDTFEALIKGQPEEMESRFDVDHGVLLQLLQRDTAQTPQGQGYRALIELIDRAHVHDGYKKLLRRKSRELFRALLEAGVVSTRPCTDRRGSEVVLEETLPPDFSLFYTLSLYALDTLDCIDPQRPDYHLLVLTIIESIIETPKVVIFAQIAKLKDELMAELKMQGVEYEERIARLEEVTNPRPDADFIYETYQVFCKQHPWAGEESVRPKSIVRDMVERYMSFNDYVNHYGLRRSEGVLLRYITQVYKALVQTVPETYLSDELVEVIAFLRTVIDRVDSSLVLEWEQLRAGVDVPLEGEQPQPPAPLDISRHPRTFGARIRAELHALLRALAQGDYEDAVASVAHDPDDPWTAERFEKALAPFLERHERLVFDHEARLPPYTIIRPDGPMQWSVRQVMVDPDGDNDWYIDGRIDLREDSAPTGPMIRVLQITDF